MSAHTALTYTCLEACRLCCRVSVAIMTALRPLRCKLPCTPLHSRAECLPASPKHARVPQSTLLKLPS